MNSKLRNDIDQFLKLYPIFSIKEDAEKVEFEGLIDIVDTDGNYWDNYEIRIVVPVQKYPNIVPLVYEHSTKIIREEDSHISANGECCLDITHNLILLQNKGIDLIFFYQNKIYPFFANHQYKRRTGNYAKGDYPHQFDGIKYFYENEIGLSDNELIIKILSLILKNKLPEKLTICICGQNKYKHCHLPTVTKLIHFGKERLSKDLTFFKAYSN
jgi:hypothetical protein